MRNSTLEEISKGIDFSSSLEDESQYLVKDNDKMETDSAGLGTRKTRSLSRLEDCEAKSKTSYAVG